MAKKHSRKPPGKKAGQLTPRHQRFVENYLIHLNAKKAAMAVGYAEKSAASAGWQMLHDPRFLAIQEEIARRQAKISERYAISRENVLKELSRLAFSDVSEVASWGPGGVVLRDSSELTEDTRRAIASIGETVTKHGSNINFKMHDKRAALQDLARHLGLMVEKHELTGANGQPITMMVEFVEAQDGAPAEH